MAIHKAGLRHNDFLIRNFLVDSLEKPTRIVVIDFEAASPHECRHPMEFPVFAKPWKSLTCREIRDIARGLELSTPGTFLDRFLYLY